MRKGENIYLRKDGRWEGRFPKGRKTNGRIKYGYVYGKSYTEVKQKLYPLRIRYQSLQRIQGFSAESFEDWTAEWLNEVQDEVKPSTLSSYRYKLTKYVLPVLNETPLNELSIDSGRSLLKILQEKLSRSTIQVIFRIVNKCLNRARKKGKIHTNPFSELTIPKAKQKKVHSLSFSEQKKIMAVAAKEKKGYGIPSLLALYSGMRIGEIAALQWSDIDFNANLIYVNHTYQRITTSQADKRTQLILADSKTEASVRMIPIGKTLKKLLLNHRKQSKGSFVFSTKGQPCEPRLLTYHFHRIREKAALAHIHFHQLRHSFATRCLEINKDISSVSALLGHASTQMTLDTYVDAMLEQRFRVIDQLDRLIS
ncbi:tyrosine-type recombinase/integrase [Enterococcus hulanensis]|uniref:tyrosine-type recombinase/integrase n=1 Tax=Enterococcus hulanensis TaxID=2559929 RepID=UPI0010F9ADA0|nr:site-specific integrase [Enterococcus hulanensis]